jgi:hypothetical protein
VANLIRDLAKGGSGDLPGGLFHGFKGDVKGKFKHHHFDPSK